MFEAGSEHVLLGVVHDGCEVVFALHFDSVVELLEAVIVEQCLLTGDRAPTR